MRLLHTHTGRFVEKDPTKEAFNYAILSHVWDTDGEQTHQELKKIQEEYAGECVFPVQRDSSDDLLPAVSLIWKDHRLSPKILNACRVARESGHRYIWIDSCCIDKRSSSELSEAINSMYAWYEGALVCYAYLADVPPVKDLEKDSSAFRGSRWFTRGWTLQELLAPRTVDFLSMDWADLGGKNELVELVSKITGISTNALLQKRRHPLRSFSVAQRLSWAARRTTTRVEDRAYSLLGIFDINMPTLYGEGEGAFMRLQEEILRRIPDQSIFAWGAVNLGPHRLSFEDFNLRLTPPQLEHGPQQQLRFTVTSAAYPSLLFDSPQYYAYSQNIQEVPLAQLSYHYPDITAPEYSFTPHGIRTQLPLIPLSAFLPTTCTSYVVGSQSNWYLAVLGCEHADYPGHILARVCYVTELSSGVWLLSRGSIDAIQTSNCHVGWRTATAFLALPVEALTRSSALARVLPVYLSLSCSRDSARSTEFTLHEPLSDYRPHKTINLLLKKKVTPRLPPISGSGPSTACVDEPATMTRSLRRLDQDHPNTHWLTISRPASQGTTHSTGQDTVTIKYTYRLENHGRRLTIVAHVTGTMRGHSVIPVQASLLTDHAPWIRREGEPYSVVLDNGNGSMAEMKLSCEYLAPNHYIIDAWFRDGVGNPCLEEDRDSPSPDTAVDISDSDSDSEYQSCDSDFGDEGVV